MRQLYLSGELRFNLQMKVKRLPTLAERHGYHLWYNQTYAGKPLPETKASRAAGTACAQSHTDHLPPTGWYADGLGNYGGGSDLHPPTQIIWIGSRV